MAALCHFYGISPGDVRDCTLGEFDALIKFRDKYNREMKKSLRDTRRS